MKDEYKVAKVGYRQGKQSRAQHTKQYEGKYEGKKEPQKPTCGYCGKAGMHAIGDRQKCPAYGKECLKCGRKNHFAICCRGGGKYKQKQDKDNRAQHQQQHRLRVRRTVDGTEVSNGDSSESDSDFIQQTAKHLKHQVRRVERIKTQQQGTVPIRMNDVDTFCEPDSGASANIMDEYQFKALRHRSQEIGTLLQTKETLRTLQSNLRVIGEFPVTLRNKTRGTHTRFLVIEGHMDSPPLLGKHTLEELGMLKIDPGGCLKASNELRIKSVGKPQADTEAILKEYSDVFQGIGIIKDPDQDSDYTEKVVRWTVATEPAIVLERIREETLTDSPLQKLAVRIQKGDWADYRRDKDIEPYYQVREDLSVMGGLIFRLDRIVMPRALQAKIIKIGHSLGHLGKTKTKQMLREKYWFPLMNSMIETAVNQCYECQVATKNTREEPVKMSTIPNEAWDTIAVDFGGPYPDGHYNLVVVDKRMRYPVVESTNSTAFKPTREKLKSIFATHGTPRRIESDNGPPFNSADFANFAKEEGFVHHRITPLHPRANGEAESFMRILNKVEQIANLQGGDHYDPRIAVHNMLTAYRFTPHPAIGVSPYDAIRGHRIRIRLDYTQPKDERPEDRAEMTRKDAKYKQKIKLNRESRRNIHEANLLLGDYVLVKQPRRNKWTTAYEPTFYIITNIAGSQIIARRVTDNRTVCRDASQFKLANSMINTASEVEQDQGTKIERGVPTGIPVGIEQHKVTTLPTPARQHLEHQEPVGVAGEPQGHRECRDHQLGPDEAPAAATEQRERPAAVVGGDPPLVRGRPSRERRQPAYLKDYIMS